MEEEKDTMAKKILIIDDDPAIHDAFSSSLEPLGYFVDTASSGEEGVTKTKAALLILSIWI